MRTKILSWLTVHVLLSWEKNLLVKPIDTRRFLYLYSVREKMIILIDTCFQIEIVPLNHSLY